MKQTKEIKKGRNKGKTRERKTGRNKRTKSIKKEITEQQNKERNQ